MKTKFLLWNIFIIIYLISASKKSVVKVWDLTNDYNLLFSLNADYSENTKIFSCIALFTENKENYLITSSNENQKNDFI